MNLFKTNLKFFMKVALLFSILLLSLLNPKKIVRETILQNIPTIQYSNEFKENLEFALTFKKIFLL